MSIVFNAEEVLKMAEQIERNGISFYRRAAEISPDNKDLLTQLAEQEDKHLATFKEMKKELEDRETESTTFDPEDEAALYLQAIANGKVFDVSKDPVDILKGDESLADIIKIAIGAEKDSIIFYNGLRVMISEKQGRGRLDDIIKEEMKHIIWLVDKL